MMTSGRPLRIALGESPGVFLFSGEIDMASAGLMEDLKVPEPTRSVVFDFTEVTFLDSSGIKALIMFSRRAACGHLVIRHPAPVVLRVLEIVDVARIPGITIET